MLLLTGRLQHKGGCPTGVQCSDMHVMYSAASGYCKTLVTVRHRPCNSLINDVCDMLLTGWYLKAQQETAICKQGALALVLCFCHVL